MISKKTPVRAAAKTKIGHLVNYLLDKKGKEDRVAAVAVTNCQSDDLQWSLIEMRAVQERNQRARGEKTYHLVISFRSGEDLPAKSLAEIEAEFAKALGFAEHQRLSVVHRDTDNLHLHVAINKVHPTRFTLHEPFNDYYTRAKLCERLERRYGLAAETQTGRTDPPAHEKAAAMEAVGGVESLIGYVQRALKSATASAGSWQELHAMFAKAGVCLQPRGNGLVVESGGQIAKASSCFRALSKTALERRFGPYEAASPSKQNSGLAGSRGYKARPMQNAGTRLYDRYQAQRTEAVDRRGVRLECAQAAHEARVRRAEAAYQTQRTIIGLTRLNPVNRVMLQLHRANLRRQIDASLRTYKSERNAIFGETKRLAWNDWLMAEAANGNHEARAVSQARRIRGTTQPPSHSAKSEVPRDGDSAGTPREMAGQGSPAYITRSGTLRGVVQRIGKAIERAKGWTEGR